MTSGELDLSEIKRSEEFLVLEESNEIGSPVAGWTVGASTTSDMEKRAFHGINIRKNCFSDNRQSNYTIQFRSDSSCE